MTLLRRSGLVILAALFALALLGVACGGDDDGDAGDSAAEELDVDDCTLLTDEEVSSLSDDPLFAGEDGFLGCGWVAEGGTVADFSLRSFRSDSSAADHAAQLAPALEAIELTGVGDEAFALVRDGEANFLVARKGELHVELVMTFLDMEVDSENLQRAQELANLALVRLEEAS